MEEEVLLSGAGHNIIQMLRMADIDFRARIINDDTLLSLIADEPLDHNG